MFRTTVAAFTFAVLSSIPTIAGAVVSIPVDANLNCIDTTSMTGGAANFQLAPGRYVASIIKNNMSCSGGNFSGNCLIDTVVIRGVDSSAQGGNATWGLAVKAPTVVDVLGISIANFVAFIIDLPCTDNTGIATLRFQKTQ